VEQGSGGRGVELGSGGRGVELGSGGRGVEQGSGGRGAGGRASGGRGTGGRANGGRGAGGRANSGRGTGGPTDQAAAEEEDAGGRGLNILNEGDDALGDLTSPVRHKRKDPEYATPEDQIMAGRQRRRARQRCREGMATPTRAHIGPQPGEEGYESSDLEADYDAAAKARADRPSTLGQQGRHEGHARPWREKETWRQKNQEIKTRIGLVQASLKLKDICQDVLYFWEGSSMGLNGDYRYFTDHTSSNNKHLPPKPTGETVSLEDYKAYMHAVLSSRHDELYLDKAANALCDMTSQGAMETVSAYRTKGEMHPCVARTTGAGSSKRTETPKTKKNPRTRPGTS
jgi:hypothetical protein